MRAGHLARFDPWIRGAAVALLVFVLVVPVPAPVLDVLLAANAGLAVAVLAACAAAAPPRIAASLPSVLLGATVFRLALELAASRAILSGGDAGRVIGAFGAAAVHGDAIVGAAVFGILALVQWIVVAQGGERVAEVAARFALDAMPGQQLAIDGAIRAGSMDARQGASERAAAERAAVRAGAMDGAMRFVKGDTLAGVAIVAVNFGAGTALGALRRGMTASSAAEHFATLAIGQGLVAQVPSMLLATAATLAVSRPRAATSAALFGPAPLRTAAAVLLLVSVAPGFPLLPFGVVAAALLAASFAPAPAAPAPRARITRSPSSAPAHELRAAWEAHFALLGVAPPAMTVADGPDGSVELDGVPCHQGECDAASVRDAASRAALRCAGVDDTERALAALAPVAPALVRTALAAAPLVELSALRRWFLEEGVPVADTRELLDAVVRAGPFSEPAEAWRRRVRRGCPSLVQAAPTPLETSAWMIGATLEAALRDDLARPAAVVSASLAEDLRALVDARSDGAAAVVIVAAEPVRRAVWSCLRDRAPKATVRSPEELPDGGPVTLRGVLDPGM